MSFFLKKSPSSTCLLPPVCKCLLLAGRGSLGRDSDPNNHTREHVTPQTGEEEAAHSRMRRASLPGIQGWSRVGRNGPNGKEWTDISDLRSVLSWENNRLCSEQAEGCLGNAGSGLRGRLGPVCARVRSPGDQGPGWVGLEC